MTVLLDTSVAVGNAHAAVDEPWLISAVTIGELGAAIMMAETLEDRAERLARLTAIMSEAPVIPLDHHVAGRYGALRAQTGRAPQNDLWIAATALAHDLVLVTTDERQAALPGVRARLLDPVASV